MALVLLPVLHLLFKKPSMEHSIVSTLVQTTNISLITEPAQTLAIIHLLGAPLMDNYIVIIPVLQLNFYFGMALVLPLAILLWSNVLKVLFNIAIVLVTMMLFIYTQMDLAMIAVIHLTLKLSLEISLIVKNPVYQQSRDYQMELVQDHVDLHIEWSVRIMEMLV